ncbi:MAG: TetR/AcrR family transcriptional regulator [Gordonia sp. (in: high G+C Gram-positive bacteria)]|uniref:TetR/AcrR family transcriptional regulator n=1 Tax=Gordonia sp. (in: high G+C Gram-positive bacteria) TaxID=84139 RepID=UPI0039E452EA
MSESPAPGARPAGRRQPGRPRLVESRSPGRSARDEILEACAELFIKNGYTKTSTRMIAEAVGIRQASIYHHFENKDDILDALLKTTVAPSLERARELLAQPGDPLDRLLRLARFDVAQLVEAEWNLGALYLLPEVREPRFADFRAARRALAGVYEELAVEVLGDRDDDRRLLPHLLVESSIMLRTDESGGEPEGLSATAPIAAAAVIETVVGAVETLLRVARKG